MDTPNAEQTASLFSLLTYSFLDPIVFLANRVPNLKPEQLPPLADYDYTKNLRAHSFPVRVFVSILLSPLNLDPPAAPGCLR